MKKRKNNALSGYMTVEAASIFVTVLSLVAFVISVGIYKYEKCCFELDSYYELQKSIQIGDRTQEYINIEGRVGSVQRQKHLTLFLGIFGRKEIELSVQAEYVKCEPVSALRFRQRMMRLQKDENGEDWSATIENGDER